MIFEAPTLVVEYIEIVLKTSTGVERSDFVLVISFDANALTFQEPHLLYTETALLSADNQVV